MEKSEADALLQALSGGTAILVLGDLSDAYDGVSSLEALRRDTLSALNVDVSSSVRLRDALKALRSRNPADAARLVCQHLENGLRDYRTLVRLIQAPWDRIYSIGGLSLGGITFETLPIQVARISADDPVPRDVTRTLLVDEGFPAEPASGLFLAGTATVQRGIWRREMSIRMLRRPTVVLAKSGHEMLWESLQSRDEHASSPCYVILEQVSVEDELAASNCEATIVRGSLQDLVNALPSGHERLQSAKRLLARSRTSAAEGVGVRLVTSLIRDTEAAPDWRFLRGFDPTWDDVKNQRLLSLPILRSVKKESTFDEGAARSVVVLKARAGAGKTAALMQFAYETAVRDSRVVVWIDRAATQSLSKLEHEISEIDPDCVVIDDVDMFGDATPSLIRRLNRNGKTLVVASVRTTRERTVGWTSGVHFVEEQELSDSDINRLEKLLNRAALLGSLQGVQPRQTRLDKIRQICKRDLLAALIQIVTGEKFEERIRNEFGQLGGDEQSVYLTLSIFVAHVNEARRMQEEDLIGSAQNGVSPGAVSAALDSLIAKRLLTVDELGVGVRHRAIADALVDGVPRARVASVIGSLLRYFAARAYAITDSSHPERRTMISLLSHSLMVRLNLPRESVRAIYSSVKELLEDDFHYWLQAGAYETEKGDFDLARSYLDSARSCPGGVNDYKVITEWGILRIGRARRALGSTVAAAEARDAILEMIQVANSHGSSTPHTYKVLASDGDAFLSETQVISATELADLRDKLDKVVSIGLTVCRDNSLAMEALDGYRMRRNVVARPIPPKPGNFPVPKPTPPVKRK